MGMKIYTRGGDKGKTSVIGGERRFKDDLRVEAYGSVDEAGSFIGLAISFLDEKRDQDIRELLLQVAQTLWDVGADLAAPFDKQRIFQLQTTHFLRAFFRRSRPMPKIRLVCWCNKRNRHNSKWLVLSTIVYIVKRQP